MRRGEIMWQSLIELDHALMLQLFGGTQPNPLLLQLMVALTVIGRGYVLWLLLALSLWPQRHAPRWLNPARQRIARELLLTLLVIAVSVYLLKPLLQRPRPYLQLHLLPLHGPPRDFSLPSGHAAGAFGFAVFLLTRVPLRRSTSAVLLALAAGIALSRCYLGAHFPSDILAGALLGAGVAWLVARKLRTDALANPPCAEA